MLHILVNKCKYRYFKLKEQIESPGSQYLRPFAIILSRHTSASLRDHFFLKLFNQSRKARKDAETQRIKNRGMTGIHHSLSKKREPIQA